MKIILIDDEFLALNYLEKQLLRIADVDIIGKFTDPFTANEIILTEKVDAVFLDIHLPEINGIELAERLLENRPDLNIIFVTAYDNYAIEAFELNALDYILKPVDSDRLLKTLERVQERLDDKNIHYLPTRKIKIKLFKQFSIEVDGTITTIHWRTAKTQELFLYLLQNRGQLVRKAALIELLWPEFEPSKAYPQLYTSIYHIRKRLESFGSHFKILNESDGYQLDINYVSIDAEEWENKIEQLSTISNGKISDFEKTMNIYDGDYLQTFEYWWAEGERQRLRSIWQRVSFQMAEWYDTNGYQQKAIDKYQEICNCHPHAEEAHFALMKIYSSINNFSAVHRQYRQLKTLLKDEFNEKPSLQITNWYNSWIKKTSNYKWNS